jgi:hypothetical protein
MEYACEHPACGLEGTETLGSGEHRCRPHAGESYPITWELKIRNRARPVRWAGVTPEAAIERYLDCRRVAGDDPLPVIVAWRKEEGPAVSVLGSGTIIG